MSDRITQAVLASVDVTWGPPSENDAWSAHLLVGAPVGGAQADDWTVKAAVNAQL